ncbi:MAG: rubrerythrin family protein [Proteobacteria bacterium]|nr:rubrerythrin family protein [Pseudomonadota bacterium]
MKQWKCTVCGYVHQDKSPPDRCPVCGVIKYRFILLEPLPDALERMLKEAFGAESKAHLRNRAFAARADAEGFPEVARLFRAVAEAERIHANEYLKYLEGVVGQTEDNLKLAFENEIRAHTESYAPFIKEALIQKREDVAWSFSRSRDVEGAHAKLYKEALTALASDKEVVYHVCGVCGNVFSGNPPDECPICGATRDSFDRVA